MSDDIVVNMNFNLGKDQTVADIVTLLRKYQPYNKLHGQAADEIERLRNAGDALAKQASRPCRCVEAHDGAINETCAPCAAFFDWEEARRG